MKRRKRKRPGSRAVARAIREARRAAGFTQIRLAERSGFSQSEISRFEAGRQDILMSTFLRLTFAMRTQPWEILKRMRLP